jgi:hypothetical protein
MQRSSPSRVRQKDRFRQPEFFFLGLPFFRCRIHCSGSSVTLQFGFNWAISDLGGCAGADVGSRVKADLAEYRKRFAHRSFETTPGPIADKTIRLGGPPILIDVANARTVREQSLPIFSHTRRRFRDLFTFRWWETREWPLP